MSNRLVIEKQETAICEALTRFPGGASIHELKEVINWELDLRQLQRRLERLYTAGSINRKGNTRAIRYYPVEPMQLLKEPEFEKRTHEILLSSVSKELLREVSRPITQRKPIAYQRNFLEQYRPNQDYYLHQSERKLLASQGRIAEIRNNDAGTFAKMILQRFLIDLSWNSSRLEGNTYSLLETERLISLGKLADGKPSEEALMILNHKQAIEFLVNAAGEIGFDRFTLLNLHSLLSDELMADKNASGRLRQIPVGIRRSVYMPLEIPQLIDDLFMLMLDKVRAIEDPFEQAFFLMVHLPYLQPFEDVNKRVSRLAVNIAFNHRNLCPLSFVDVPHDLYIKGLLAVYELNRVELLKEIFLWAYDRSSLQYAALRQVIGDPDPFHLKYRAMIKSLIHAIITAPYTKDQAILFVREESATIPESDRARFIQVVETKLLALNEGNYAKYQVLPSQFRVWFAKWK